MAITTIDDVLNLIGRRADYDVKFLYNGSIEVEAYPYRLKLKAVMTIYHWIAQSVEDLNDKDEGYSSEPTEDIINFMIGDIPGNAFLEKYASCPVVFLERLAEAIEHEKNDPRVASAVLKRLSNLVKFVRTNPRPVLMALHKDEIEKLSIEMSRKGWNFVHVTDDSGLPALEFDVGDRYWGKIMLSDIVYDYEFSIDEYPDVTESGSANDIEERLRMWVRRDDVNTARKNAITLNRTYPATPPKSLNVTKPTRK